MAPVLLTVQSHLRLYNIASWTKFPPDDRCARMFVGVDMCSIAKAMVDRWSFLPRGRPPPCSHQGAGCRRPPPASTWPTSPCASRRSCTASRSCLSSLAAPSARSRPLCSQVVLEEDIVNLDVHIPPTLCQILDFRDLTHPVSECILGLQRRPSPGLRWHKPPCPRGSAAPGFGHMPAHCNTWTNKSTFKTGENLPYTGFPIKSCNVLFGC